MKKRIIKVIKILAYIFILMIVMPIVILIGLHLKSDWEHECQRGPLESVSKCKFNTSMVSWMNSGPWYSDAKGYLDEASCNIITEGEDQLSFAEMQGRSLTAVSIYKISCESLGHGVKGTCYASQKMSSNGNTRYVKILIADGCDNARYFEGSKYKIQDGDVIKMDSEWTIPLKDIPDENTGKVEPVQVFG